MRHENIVYGGSLDALLYALHHDYPIIYSNPEFPLFFEKSDASLWTSAYFYLSLGGLVPFSDKVKKTKYEPGNLIVVTERQRTDVSFGHLFVFDDSLSGLPEFPSRIVTEVRTYDHMIVRSILPDDIEGISCDHGELIFYQSPRADRPDLKDLCLVRTHRDGQYRHEQASELYSRFMVEELLSSYCKKSVVVESNYRETRETVKPVCPDVDDVTFIQESPARVLMSDNEYIKFLIRSLEDD